MERLEYFLYWQAMTVTCGLLPEFFYLPQTGLAGSKLTKAETNVLVTCSLEIGKSHLELRFSLGCHIIFPKASLGT